MPEMQKSVLEHAAPKANQNQGLDSHLADEATTSMQKADEFVTSERSYPSSIPATATQWFAFTSDAAQADLIGLPDPEERHIRLVERYLYSKGLEDQALVYHRALSGFLVEREQRAGNLA